MTNLEVPRVRVTRQVMAGSKVWGVGEYPTPVITNIEPLYRVADHLEESEVPFNQRSVVYIGNKAEKLTDDESGDKINENEGLGSGDNTDGEGEEYELNIPSKEEFDSLKADDQKAVLTDLLANEDISDDDLYSILNEYLEVATAKSVIKIINDELAKFI